MQQTILLLTNNKTYSSTAIFSRRCHHSIPVRRNQRIAVPTKAGKAGRIQFYLFLQQ